MEILLTGATGVLGSEILKELLSQGHKVYVLMRARNSMHMAVRKQKLLHQLNLNEYAASLDALKGDVTKVDWGLSKENLKILFANVDHILHCAGEVKLNQSDTESIRNNVKPVEELIKMYPNFKKLKKIDVISTVGVGGKSVKKLPEGFLTFEPLFHNQYERGKYKAEVLIKKAIDQGAPITVHRPSMIVGHSKTGNIYAYQVFYYLCEIITGRKSFGVLPHLNQRSLDLIPVDIAAQAIAKAAFDTSTIGKIFNVSSGDRRSLFVDELAEKVGEIFNKHGQSSKIRFRIPDKLIKEFIQWSDFIELEKISPFLYSLKYIVQYFFTDHVFENKNFEAFCKQQDLQIPNVEDYLDVVLNEYLENKYKSSQSNKKALRSFVREIKVIEFYRDYIWPIHRKFVKDQLTPRCKKCSLSANISHLKEDLCEFCREPMIENKNQNLTLDYDQLDFEMEKLIASKISKAPLYDALVLFSGGKDSAYMVYRLLKDWPRIRILALTVDNTFLSPLAYENIKKVILKLEVDHQMIRPNRELMRKMFSYAFTHLNEEGCYGTVDRFDGDFIHDVARNVAAQMEIPMIFSGLTPTQAKMILNVEGFETSRDVEMEKRQEVAGIPLEKVFSQEEMLWWWNGKKWSRDRVPHMIFPFCAWNLSEEQVKKAVVKAGIIEQGNQSPLLTNYRLVPLMGLVDMAQFGYSSFEQEFAYNARIGKADPILWRNTFEIIEYAAKTGLFINDSIDGLLKDLNLSREDVKLPKKEIT